MSAILDDLIRSRVEHAGADASISDVLVPLIRSHLAIGEDGNVRVLNADGNPRVGKGPDYNDMTVAEFVEEFAASRPRLFGRTADTAPDPVTPQPTAPSPAPAGETMTARILRLDRERRDAAKASPELNPWRPETASLTMQIAITAKDPARAARLKAEAGIA